MANHVSALKRARQTETRSERNRANASRLRTSLRGLRTAIDSGDQKAAKEKLGGAISAIDKAIRKGTIHRNTAARYKSRLTARVTKMGAK